MGDRSPSCPPGWKACHSVGMHPVLKSCRVFHRYLLDLIDLVRAGVGIGGGIVTGTNAIWPRMAPRAVARRFAAALRLVEAYLRRMLLLMALRFEPTLVDKRRPLKRVKDRKRRLRKAVRFAVLFVPYRPMTDKVLYKFDEAARLKRERPRPPPKLVSMLALYRRLDWLTAEAADPVQRAKRLALNLARRRPGPIFVSDWAIRMPQRYGTEISMTFNALAHVVLEESKARPPPLPPLQRYGPSVTLI
jgi:hypothetical protein